MRIKSKNKILLIGKKSILASNIYSSLKKFFFIRQIEFKDFLKENYLDFDCIINCSINKKYLNNKYNRKFDNDLKIAKKLNDKQSYIFLSTCKVYKISEKNISEKSKIKPLSTYAKNKLMTEKKLKKLILPKKLLILRLSNLVCFEIQKKIVKTFVHTMLNTLFYKKKIFLPNNKVYKYFITIRKFCDILKKIIFFNKLSGIYNVSSGFKYDIGLLANKMVDGYRKGTILQKKNIKTDSFVISSKKLQKKLQIKINYEDVPISFYYLGKKLRNYG
jgi:dTDP-4-dehydrorhamnose reductase